jgi:hypothetical protein
MATIDFSDGKLVASVKSTLENMTSLGNIPLFVGAYLKKGEVDPASIAPDQDALDALHRRMWAYLRSRGVKFKNDRLDANGKLLSDEYDEILYSAYDEAARARSGREDPLEATRSGQPIAEDVGWDFRVETFDAADDQGVLPESIRAAGAIDYVYELGERMGVFKLAEALVLQWAAGDVDVEKGEAAARLYRYWKLLDDRSDEAERGMLYRRVLNKGSGEILSRMVANEAFPHLWSNLMNEVATYIDKSEQVDQGRRDGSPVSPAPVYQAIRELQYNLTEYCSGMAFMQVRELYAQLTQAFDILRDPDVVAHFGGPRRRNMWTAIERLSKQEFGRSVPIGPLLRVAVDGNKVFQLVAAFDEATFTQTQFIELIDAAESYIINSSVVDAQLGDVEAVGERLDEESEEDFEDDFAESDEDF